MAMKFHRQFRESWKTRVAEDAPRGTHFESAKHTRRVQAKAEAEHQRGRAEEALFRLREFSRSHSSADTKIPQSVVSECPLENVNSLVHG
jgi:hypothetical protein